MNLKMLVAASLLVLATVASGADADLGGRIQKIEGDLGLAETDRIAFTAPAGTRLDVRLEGNGILAPQIRVVGPSGVLDSASRMRVERDGQKVRLKWLRLRETGSYRIELVGSQPGEYEGRVKLDIPSKVKEEVSSSGPGGPPDVKVVLPPGAEWKRIRVKPRSGGPTVDVASFTDPEGDVFAMTRRERRRGFKLLPDGDARSGIYVLRLRHLGGAGAVRIEVRYRRLSGDAPELDLTDGTLGDDGPAQGQGATQGEILVRLAKGTRLEDFLEDHDDVELEEITGTGYYRVRLEDDDDGDDDDEEEALEELFEDPAVLHVERNLLAEAPEGGQSSIPVLDDNLDEEQARTQPALDGIGALIAQVETRGAGVVVAVLDTGVDLDHPFLVGRIAPGGQDLVGFDADPREERNGLDDDGDGDVDEGYGHGTFVAGLVLAVAPEATILPFRVLNSDARGEAAIVAEAVILAVDAGADVINLSLGTTTEARVIREAVRYAHERGVPVVVAAGNEADQIQFPARYGNTLAVTAVNADGVAAAFTNLGSAADLAAPGVDVIGPVPLDLGGAWARWSGTSFAAPLVSGAAALLRAAQPFLDGDDVADRLIETAEDLDAVNPTVEGLLGEGLVRPDRAISPD